MVLYLVCGTQGGGSYLIQSLPCLFTLFASTIPTYLSDFLGNLLFYLFVSFFSSVLQIILHWFLVKLEQVLSTCFLQSWLILLYKTLMLIYFPSNIFVSVPLLITSTLRNTLGLLSLSTFSFRPRFTYGCLPPPLNTALSLHCNSAYRWPYRSPYWWSLSQATLPLTHSLPPKTMLCGPWSCSRESPAQSPSSTQWSTPPSSRLRGFEEPAALFSRLSN